MSFISSFFFFFLNHINHHKTACSPEPTWRSFSAGREAVVAGWENQTCRSCPRTVAATWIPPQRVGVSWWALGATRGCVGLAGGWCSSGSGRPEEMTPWRSCRKSSGSGGSALWTVGSPRPRILDNRCTSPYWMIVLSGTCYLPVE